MTSLVVPPINATVYYKDDQVQKPKLKEYAPIGIVVSPTTKNRGTAFLVDQCHILTSQHIESVDPQLKSPAPRLYFFYGVGKYKGFEKPVAGTVVRYGGFDGGQDFSDDWTLIRLDECVGARIGYLRISSLSPKAVRLKNLQIASFPEGRDYTQGVWIDPSCNIRGARGRAWLHDCAADANSSGAPIFYLTEERKNIVVNVVGLQAAGVVSNFAIRWESAVSNVAVRADVIRNAIKNDIHP